MIHVKAEIFYKDGRVESLSELTDDEIYPEHIPSRTLVDLLLGMGDNPAPGRSAARVVEFLEAAYRSAELGLPIKLTL